jgi:16S rRNA (cytosine967-C5)-methyltransferase
MIAPARVAAYKILSSVSAGSADLPTAIASARSGLAGRAGINVERDCALASDIATGVQRMRAALDHLITAFSNRTIDRLDPEIVEILRLSAYQLLYHSRVPASAVVDDAVDLARRAGKQSASGFVNAVLRTISRNRDSLPLPPRPAEVTDRAAALSYLSITLSHPLWLATRWYDRLGFETAEAWLTFNNAPAPLTLRANTLRLSGADLVTRLASEGVVVRPTRFAPDGFIVESGHPLASGGFNAGWFVVQDEASQLVALLAGAAPGPSVLDACASPGGKTTAIAAAMKDAGLLVACDVRSRRIELLGRTVKASGAHRIRIVQADLLTPLPFRQGFDCVVVDAPCSGLGILRRDPDIRWRRRESDLAPLAAAQVDMLVHAAEVVAPAGRLIYATCSSEPEENEDVADRFLAAAPQFVAIDARASAVLPATVVDERGHLRTLPHVHGLESFFGAVFERRGRP